MVSLGNEVRSLRALREPTDVLVVTEQPVPEPGPGEVRLKIKLSPVSAP